MPLDNSNTQSFRTHRLRCKAIAGGLAVMPLSNEQTVSESTFIDYKLGKMPYLVQPSSGGPVITDAGCCGNGNIVCSVCAVMVGLIMKTATYTIIRNTVTSGSLPAVPGTYMGEFVILLSGASCGQTYNITQLNIILPITGPITRTPPYDSIAFTNCTYYSYAAPQDGLVIFDDTINDPSLVVSLEIEIIGTIETCGTTIINTPPPPGLLNP